MTEAETKTTEARAALERASEPKPKRDVRALLERNEPALIQSLQSKEAAAILWRHYLTAIRLNPMLQECSDESLVAALLLSAQMRLEPGPLGHVYLVPYGKECTWILGYTGILELARRSERCASLRAHIVWDCDVYERPRDSQAGVRWSLDAGPEENRTEWVGGVVAWEEKSGGRWSPRALDVPLARIERARNASRAKQGPWITDTAAMIRKTCVRFARPWLPLSADAGRALATDGATVTGWDENTEPVIVPADGEES